MALCSSHPLLLVCLHCKRSFLYWGYRWSWDRALRGWKWKTLTFLTMALRWLVPPLPAFKAFVMPGAGPAILEPGSVASEQKQLPTSTFPFCLSYSQTFNT